MRQLISARGKSYSAHLPSLVFVRLQDGSWHGVEAWRCVVKGGEASGRGVAPCFLLWSGPLPGSAMLLQVVVSSELSESSEHGSGVLEIIWAPIFLSFKDSLCEISSVFLAGPETKRYFTQQPRGSALALLFFVSMHCMSSLYPAFQPSWFIEFQATNYCR